MKPASSDKRQIVINAGSNACVMAAKVAITFVVTPLLVHGLGDTRYGIWMLVGSVAAYLFLAEFGVRSAVMRYVAQYDGLRDPAGINRVVNTSIALMTAAGSLVLLASVLLALFWRHPASVPAQYVAEARHFLVLQGVLAAALLPVSVPGSLLAGLGRFPARNLVSFASLLFRNALLVGVVWYGGGLVAIGYALLVCCAADGLAGYWAAKRCFPQLNLSWRHIDRPTIRQLGGYSAHVFAADVAFLIVGQSAPLIISLTLTSSDAITYFSLGGSLRDYALTILGAVVIVIMPAVSKWDSTNRHDSVRQALLHGIRYALYFAAPIECGLLILGRPFLALWMGSSYAEAGAGSLAILALPLVSAAASQVATRVLQGLGHVRALALITMLQATLTVGLGIVLARPLGIEGVALGASLAVLTCSPTVVYLACRRADLGLGTLLRDGCWKPIVASSGAVLAWLELTRWLVIDSWGKFVIVGSLGSAVFGLLMLVLEPQVRKMLRLAGPQLMQSLRQLRSTPEPTWAEAES